VTNVSYIPLYSQPYVAINLTSGYATNYEIIAGFAAINTSRSGVSDIPANSTNLDIHTYGSTNSTKIYSRYDYRIIQARPGDTLTITGRIKAGGYTEYCEFWIWLGSSWFRFDYKSASVSGTKDFIVNLALDDSPRVVGGVTLRIIPEGTTISPGNYALGVTCSYGSVGSASYRSWRSFSLEIY